MTKEFVYNFIKHQTLAVISTSTKENKPEAAIRENRCGIAILRSRWWLWRDAIFLNDLVEAYIRTQPQTYGTFAGSYPEFVQQAIAQIEGCTIVQQPVAKTLRARTVI